MKEYIKDALNISELQIDLENISQDDNKAIEEYTRKEIVEEEDTYKWVDEDLYDDLDYI